MTKRPRRQALLCLGLCLTLTSCSGKPDKPDGPPTEEGTEDSSPDTAAMVDKQALPLLPARAMTMAKQAPTPKLIEESQGVKHYKIGDVELLYKANPAKPIVSVDLFFKGGSLNLSPKTQGIEQLALSVAASGGTRNTPKDKFNAKLDSVGASIGSFNDRDFSGMSMKSVVQHFDTVWQLFTEATLQPAFPKDEVEIQRKRQLAAIDQLFESSDSHVGYIATQLLFKGHPYADLQLGTRENVSSFTPDQLRGYHSLLLDPRRIVIVVVGPMPEETILEKVANTFGRLPRSKHLNLTDLPRLETEDFAIEVAEKKGQPTNYIFGLFTAPAPGHKDYPAILLATEHLDNRLFEEIRTKRGLTYAVSAGLSSRQSNYGYLYVTAEDPAKTIPAIYAEIDRLAKAPIPPESLESTLNVYITRHYMKQQSNGSIAYQLGQAHIVAGSYKAALDEINQLRKVTPADLQRVYQSYFKNLQYGVVGNPSSIDESVFKR